MLSREEADRRLARLGVEHEAIETSLLALQDHAGRRLLEGTELIGATAERWTAAEKELAALWACFEEWGKRLEDARAVRARRRFPGPEELARLVALLEEKPAGSPESADGDDTSERGAPGGWAAAVERLNTGYAEVLDVVVAADSVWSALPARIDLLGAELRRLTALAHSSGVRPGSHPAGDDLARVTGDLTALRAEVLADPLAFWLPAEGSATPGAGRPDTTRYDRAAALIEDIRREVDAVIAARRDSEERLVRLRDVLSRADRTLAEARLARGEVLSRIAATEVPVITGPASALREELTAAAEYRRDSQWHRLSPLLDSLEERAQEELERARDALTAVTAPLAVRAELRGRLDAYHARAGRSGAEGDPELTRHYDTARRMLWSSPCDLRAAERAVIRYRVATTERLAEVGAGAAGGTAASGGDHAPGGDPAGGGSPARDGDPARGHSPGARSSEVADAERPGSPEPPGAAR
ncbi:hypothetical protein [Streptomyces sp. ST2-7A]|uniref:hypothetical protein n=1 Tax=Streptomyces sp. ST2-7A TaxID=2907214 RepID=UPI001F3C00D9|nr:hypothetical protein [Streptomyces sp. ST2-7A]MCE7079255.1 hypothetical protein [Streptomyces sp. ST2-7A]